MRSTAYHCGRVLATLVEIGRRAGVALDAERVLLRAQVAPAEQISLVATRHWEWLTRLPAGEREQLQDALTAAMAHLDTIPERLTVREQAEFVLGYHQQRAAIRAPEATTKEAARELGVTPQRVRALAAQGRIRGARKVGRDWLIPRPVVILPGRRGPQPRWAGR